MGRNGVGKGIHGTATNKFLHITNNVLIFMEEYDKYIEALWKGA